MLLFKDQCSSFTLRLAWSHQAGELAIEAGDFEPKLHVKGFHGVLAFLEVFLIEVGVADSFRAFELFLEGEPVLFFVGRDMILEMIMGLPFDSMKLAEHDPLGARVPFGFGAEGDQFHVDPALHEDLFKADSVEGHGVVGVDDWIVLVDDAGVFGGIAPDLPGRGCPVQGRRPSLRGGRVRVKS